MSVDLDNSPMRPTLSTETVAPRDTRRMTTCPRCHSGAVRRSRSRTWWESVRKTITSQRPYRCDRCDWRGWRAVDPAQEAGLRTDAPRPGRPDGGSDDRSRLVNLESLDTPETPSGDEPDEEDNMKI